MLKICFDCSAFDKPCLSYVHPQSSFPLISADALSYAPKLKYATVIDIILRLFG